ncbi:MAG: metal ABC transporter ATP-binding protein [Lachnospiraceae bacterium]|nr:metal ABC transporter ATP-binding protein [Lachnospiraceae bacterium]
MSYIIGRNLAVGYEGCEVLSNVSFEVGKGDYLCIVGENGSGKTTLMKTILGLLQPISGTVSFEDGLKKNEVGYLPQQSQAQKDFPASVEEIVYSGFQGRMGFRPFYSKSQKQEAHENMERMQILDLAKKCYRELSGGQQQRVLLARALCASDKVLLLDEPVSGLDPNVTAGMYELIEQLNHDGVTIIMISHDIEAAVKYASHILHVNKHIFFGTKEEYMKSDIGFYRKGGE